MKTSDYIVSYLIEKGITDVFGYPGGMVTHLLDSLDKYKNQISAHLTYHEQGAAFAACGYAQVSGRPGVAYATSGPGATNLITGICNAYFDSIPVIFITGQVNTFEAKGELGVRQRGFQETDIVSMVKSVAKYTAYVEDARKIKYYLDNAYNIAMQGRKGPVLLDIPMDIFRAEIDLEELTEHNISDKEVCNEQILASTEFIRIVKECLMKSERPCFLAGNGVKIAGAKKEYRELVAKLGIPVISSMISFDIIPNDDSKTADYGYGFVGAYGDRFANFILAKSDLIITLGTRLDVRQVGKNRESFAPDAKIIRVDIDWGELNNKIREDEIQFAIGVDEAIKGLSMIELEDKDFSKWIYLCKQIKETLSNLDITEPNMYINEISQMIPDNRIITTDVGQNQVWIAQSFSTKANQEILFSGGHGAMGYSLPAAIGAYYGSRKHVICFAGDGGIQMNIQELQFIAREKLPIKIVVLNNFALGMIRHFQEMYFGDRYIQTVSSGGYTVPDFCAIAEAYNIKSCGVFCIEDLKKINFNDNSPELIEVNLTGKTYVFPKLEFGKPNQDQEPLIKRDVYDYLMQL